METFAYPSSSEVSQMSALHRKDSPRCRDAAACVINPLHKSSLFSSHFKLHGISVAPDSHQSFTSLSISALVFTAIRHPQMSAKPIEFWGRNFWKIQSKHCNGEVLPADVRRQNIDNTLLHQILKITFQSFYASPACLLHSFSPDTYMHNHTERKSLREHWLGVFCFHWSPTQI